jgi:hypothetical protein
MSSSAMLRKLLRRFDLPEEQPRPKMFTPFPKDSGDAWTGCGLHGVVGEPNSCNGRENLPKLAAGAGVPPPR